jgi:hypothetical protein
MSEIGKTVCLLGRLKGITYDEICNGKRYKWVLPWLESKYRVYDLDGELLRLYFYWCDSKGVDIPERAIQCLI